MSFEGCIPRLVGWVVLAMLAAIIPTGVLSAKDAVDRDPSAAAHKASFGIWSNPQNSVHVRAQPCGGRQGERMCGVVVWANEKARADARRAGTDSLDGLILFRDFMPRAKGVWRGKVFVPDMGRTFQGTVTLRADGRLEGRGCVAGGIICKSQIWSRVP